MSDYLLVSGAGLGGWAWGQTWGYMTAPVGHPPRLDQQHPVGKAICINLGGYTGKQTNPSITQQDSVAVISEAVKDNALRDVVLVGHDVAASLVLRAATVMEVPPKRLVLVGGVIPAERRSPLSVIPLYLRLAFTMMTTLNGSGRRGFKLPKHVISNVMCSAMEAEEVIQAVGFFQPVPIKVMKGKVTLRGVETPCPITYVVLIQDKLLSQTLQRRMALRLGQVEIEDLEACHAAMLHRPRELADILLRYA